MVVALLLALMDLAEVTAYGQATLRDHFLAIFVAAWLVGVTHEFAHGMTCKAFGARATEVGVLMVYYFLPALYFAAMALPRNREGEVNLRDGLPRPERTSG